jgi:hypothetical protein
LGGDNQYRSDIFLLLMGDYLMTNLTCPYCGGKLRKDGYDLHRDGSKVQSYECTNCLSKSRGSTIGIKSSGGNIEIIHENNGEIIDCSSNRLRTLNDVVRECKVDLRIWKVDKYIINKWEVGTKQLDGSIVTEPLFQVKVWLSKRIPDEIIFPSIQPINIKIDKIEYKNNNKSLYLKKAMIIADSQNGYNKDINSGQLTPFHDRKAWDIVCQISQDIKFDLVIALGDMIDLSEFSDKFIKSPSFYFTTQPALLELNWWLTQLSHIKEKIYLCGNHEDRLERSIINNMVSAYGLKSVNELKGPDSLSIDNLLNLKEIGFKYFKKYPTDEFWINDNLKCRHGTVIKQGSGDSVKEILKNTRCSEIIGHIHRQELAMKTVHVRDGEKSYVVFSPGILARIDGVVPSHNGKENWQQGCGIVYYEEKNGYFNIHPIQIYNGKAIVCDKIYEGKDRLSDIRKNLSKSWGF